MVKLGIVRIDRAVATTVLVLALCASACSGENGNSTAAREDLAASRPASSVESDLPVEGAETKSISFTNAFLPLDAALDAAQVAVRGTVVDSYVVPLDSDEVALYNDDKSLTEDPFLAGRRVFELKVSEVYRGDVKPGDIMRVWFGSELQPGVRAEGSPDSVAEPAVRADVIVLSEPVIDMPYLGTVYLPLEGSGVGTVDEGSVVIEPVTDALEEVARDLVEVEKQLHLPATGAPRS